MVENTKTVHSFVSDAIFQYLMEEHKVEMLAGAAAMFYGLYSALSLGLFRNICLWLKPVNGQRIVAVLLY